MQKEEEKKTQTQLNDVTNATRRPSGIDERVASARMSWGNKNAIGQNVTYLYNILSTIYVFEQRNV